MGYLSAEQRIPVVSIHCLVYNHEKYIRQCLDGFVMQQTNFAFEAIVHDDVSTDGSVAIIKEYAERYPEIIKPIIETENQYSKGGFAHVNNILRKNSQGRYIAWCEGDDYWIDPHKLQKQVDYLEAHPEICMCTHAWNVVTCDGKSLGSVCVLNHDGMLDAGKVIQNVYAPQTATFLYRNEGCIPSFFTELSVGDYPIRVFNAISGGIYYMNTVMSCYRRYSNGSWTSQMTGDTKKYLSHLSKMIDFSRKLDEYTEGKYHDQLLFRIDYCNFLMFVRKKDYTLAFRTNYFKNKNFKEKLALLIQTITPKLWFFLQKVNKQVF